MITKKNIIAFITPMFDGCDMRMLRISDFEIKVNIYFISGISPEGSLDEFLKILKVINDSEYINSDWEVWREVGWYDETNDITLDFRVYKDKVKEYLKSK